MDEVLENVLVPERLDGESFDAYKIRRSEGNLVSKMYRHNGGAKMFWNSKDQGTFRKSKEQ